MNICVFGDSITWGACDYKNGGWATVLRNYFEERGDTPLGIDGSLVDVSLYNLGISGDNTDDLLLRFKAEARAREPEVIVFAIGVNDSQYTGSHRNSRVPKEKFVANLEELITQAKGFTNKILFVGLAHVEESKVMPVPWSDKNKNYDNANIDLYNSLIKDICEKHNLPFLNILDLLTPDDLEDGLHPNANGHRKMFETIKEFVVANI